jgi:K+-transporting ATPase ATPase A chain
MVVITFLMFAGATTGVAAGAGFVRGLARSSSKDVGNFWVDFVRVFWRVLLPLSFIMALVYVWQGIPQTLHAEAVATTLEGGRQQLLMGPVASLESIKHLGTNGGGLQHECSPSLREPDAADQSAAHLSMLLIPAGMTYAFGSMLLRRKQGWVLFAACMVMFVGFLSLVFVAEQNGSQLLARAGRSAYSLTQSGGNMEGKELRFGIADTALFVATTTAATTGSVNAMHDSLTPLGSITPLAQMMLNCVFGGDGVD